MIHKTTISPSQSSHGGTLYYIYEIPKDQYHYKKIRKNFDSTDSGWDNPFRPDGDLSREADEIVNLIKGGKPITPTGELLLNGESQVDGQETNGNGLTVVDDDGATKLEASPLLNQANGTKSPQKGNGETAKEPQPKVSIQVVPGQQSASCVVIDEKKKKKRCCVIQ